MLKEQIKTMVKEKSLLGNSNEQDANDFIVTRHRHRVLLEETLQCLKNFLNRDLEIDMAAEELRMAVNALSRVTGHIDVEEVLDVVFRDFCIGK